MEASFEICGALGVYLENIDFLEVDLEIPESCAPPKWKVKVSSVGLIATMKQCTAREKQGRESKECKAARLCKIVKSRRTC